MSVHHPGEFVAANDERILMALYDHIGRHDAEARYRYGGKILSSFIESVPTRP